LLDETGSFTVSAQVRLNPDLLNAKPVGYQAQIAGQRLGGESSWALWAVRAEAGWQWKFSRTTVDGTGKPVNQAATLQMDDIAAVGTWVDVTGVYDAQAWADTQDSSHFGSLQLYVGSTAIDPGPTANLAGAQHGSGEMAVGRGTQSGVAAHYLPGDLQKLRIWTGAMTENQVSEQVLTAQALSTL
jgi:hypothetical protein